MLRLPLACSVRDCALPLEHHGRAFACPRGHAYDVAKSGYLNLLQPQDRRSRLPGDSKAAVDARARLLATGVGRTIVDAFVERAARLDIGEQPVVVDLGSGSGEALATLADRRSISGIGIDLSSVAAEHAARRFPALTWVVANADRRLPLLDRSVDLVLSLHARRNANECARILQPAGFLLVAIPAPDDLIELRAGVLGQGIQRSRSEALLAEHEPFFRPIELSSARERHRLGRESLLDLLRGTYRGERASMSERVEALDSLEVTLASEYVLFAARA